MPELPEVEVTRRGLAPHLAGRVISAVEVREPRLRWPVPQAVRKLAGLTVRAVHRRGRRYSSVRALPRARTRARRRKAPARVAWPIRRRIVAARCRVVLAALGRRTLRALRRWWRLIVP